MDQKQGAKLYPDIFIRERMRNGYVISKQFKALKFGIYVVSFYVHTYLYNPDRLESAKAKFYGKKYDQ